MNADSPGVDGSADARPDTPIDYEAFQAQPEFQELKSRFRRFTFPLAIAFIVWFLGFVLLGAYNHAFMAKPLLGMNVGLWLGLAQFVTTFGITMWYVAFANKRLDPASTALRAELETLAAAGDAHAATEGGTR